MVTTEDVQLTDLHKYLTYFKKYSYDLFELVFQHPATHRTIKQSMSRQALQNIDARLPELFDVLHDYHSDKNISIKNEYINGSSVKINLDMWAHGADAYHWLHLENKAFYWNSVTYMPLGNHITIEATPYTVANTPGQVVLVKQHPRLLDTGTVVEMDKKYPGLSDALKISSAMELDTMGTAVFCLKHVYKKSQQQNPELPTNLTSVI